MTLPANRRAITAANRRDAVTQAIASMRERLDEPQDLHDIAQSAWMSRSHFHRVFRNVTTATPKRFLTALRMAEAKRLLLETTMSATDVSVVVGYSSFGTFTTQFTKLVGLPPGRFRACAAPIAETPVRELLGHRLLDREPAAGCVRGQLSSRPDGSAGIALSGVFPSGIPQGRPLACAVVPPSGSVMLPAVDIPGDAEVLTVSFGSDATVRAVLTESPKAGFFFGATRMPGVRKGAAPLPRFSIQLRPPRATDPPLLIALPLLTAAP